MDFYPTHASEVAVDIVELHFSDVTNEDKWIVVRDWAIATIEGDTEVSIKEWLQHRDRTTN